MMKIQFLTKGIYCLVILFVSAFNNISAQESLLKSPDKPYFYISAAYVGTSSINQATNDIFYSAGNHLSFMEKTGRLDIGLQFNRHLSFEVGIIENDLWLSNELVIDNQILGGGGRSWSPIRFYSFKLKHHLILYKNRIKLNTGLGFALGNSQAPLSKWGPSEPRTFTSYGNTISTIETLEGLHNGTSNFITFDLGIEFVLLKKISLFSNVSVYKGFTDLQQLTFDYIINDIAGSSTFTTDGSFAALEFGLKYSFR